MKESGISLTCQVIRFGGEGFISVAANYITEEWQLTQRTLRWVRVVLSNLAGWSPASGRSPTTSAAS